MILGWISGPLPAILTALCTLPLLSYSLDQAKYRVIQQALSERRKPMTGESPHR
jgi:Na+/melibiose symporter-like transporter